MTNFLWMNIKGCRQKSLETKHFKNFGYVPEFRGYKSLKAAKKSIAF